MTLENFCKDIDKNGELIRCCSCFNTLAMAGEYEIKPIPDKVISFLPDEKVQGLICEQCIKNGREPVKAVVIVGENDNEKVLYVNVDDLADTKKAAEAKAKKKEKESGEEADSTPNKST